MKIGTTIKLSVIWSLISPFLGFYDGFFAQERLNYEFGLCYLLGFNLLKATAHAKVDELH